MKQSICFGEDYAAIRVILAVDLNLISSLCFVLIAFVIVLRLSHLSTIGNFVVLFYFALLSSFSIKLRFTDQTILSHFCPPFCLSEMDFA